MFFRINKITIAKESFHERIASEDSFTIVLCYINFEEEVTCCCNDAIVDLEYYIFSSTSFLTFTGSVNIDTKHTVKVVYLE